MKSIFNGKMYDTDKSENVCNIFNHSVYRTNKEVLFTTCCYEKMGEQISSTNQEEIKSLIGRYCPETYIELFGEVEET